MKTAFPTKALQVPTTRRYRRTLRSIHAGPGFTLIELLVTVAIIGIVAAIAIPAFQVMNDSANCKNASRTVSSDLAFIKMRAISQGTRTKLLFLSSTSYKFQVDNGGSWQDLSGEAVRDLTVTSSPYFFKDVIFNFTVMNNPSTPPDGKDVVFLPSGSCQTCGSGSISINVNGNGGNKRKVSVYGSGKIEEIKL